MVSGILAFLLFLLLSGILIYALHFVLSGGALIVVAFILLIVYALFFTMRS